MAPSVFFAPRWKLFGSPFCHCLRYQSLKAVKKLGGLCFAASCLGRPNGWEEGRATGEGVREEDSLGNTLAT